MLGWKNGDEGAAWLRLLVGLALFWMIGNGAAVKAASVTLSWSPSPSSTVAGYLLQCGTTPGSYPLQVNAGANTSGTLTGLTAGTTYYIVVTAYSAGGMTSSPSNEVVFATAPEAVISPGRIANLSNLVVAGDSKNVATGGFVISGTGQKTLVLRALGPSLTKYGLSGIMPDPAIEVYDSSGRLLGANDNWMQTQASFFGLGGAGHSLQPTDNREAALMISLPPGSYTTAVHGQPGTSGFVATEIYDFSNDTGTLLTSITARTLVSGSTRTLIGSLTLTGSNKVILRALGPSLSRLGLSGVLSDPELSLYDANGTLVRTNDNWGGDSTQVTAITSAGYAPGNYYDSAMLLTLPAGTYTAIVRGSNGATGLAQFEAYRLP